MTEEEIKKLKEENERLRLEVEELKKKLAAKTKAEADAESERQKAEAAVKSKKDEEIDRLKKENESLKKQIEELSKQVKGFEEERQKSARNARASELVALWEKRGRKFKDEAERTAEIERLAGLEDSAFEATKSVIDSLPEAKAEEGDPEKDKGKKVLRSDAGVDPAVVDDKTDGLTDRLTKGLREVREAQVA